MDGRINLNQQFAGIRLIKELPLQYLLFALSGIFANKLRHKCFENLTVGRYLQARNERNQTKRF